MADRTRYSAHSTAARKMFATENAIAGLSLQRRAGISGLKPARTRMITAIASHTVSQSSLWTSVRPLLVEFWDCSTRGVYIHKGNKGTNQRASILTMLAW